MVQVVGQQEETLNMSKFSRPAALNVMAAPLIEGASLAAQLLSDWSGGV